MSRQRVEEVLDAVGMRERADEPVRLLSRGMVQRLAVCRAVLHRPSLLLLDEPLANLDPAATELVEPADRPRRAGPRGCSTSHDPRAALAEADLVLGLQGGRAAFLTEPSRVDPDSVARLYAEDRARRVPADRRHGPAQGPAARAARRWRRCRRWCCSRWPHSSSSTSR